MSWIDGLVSSLGVPAGVATLVGAMYAGCAAAEKAARPEALTDIGRILKNTSWERSVRPSAIIQRVFVWTFGERHLSWRCVLRSAWASIFMMVALALTLNARDYSRTGRIDVDFPTLEDHSQFSLNYGMVLGGLVADYVALGKARFLMRLMKFKYEFPAVVPCLLIDLVLSCLISLLTLGLVFLLLTVGTAFFWKVFLLSPLAATERLITHTAGLVKDSMTGTLPMPVFVVSFSSTVFTSGWMALVLIASAFIKVLSPIHRFTAWFFDVDKHPVQAIGIVAGGLVMLGAAVWSLVRWLV